MLEAKELRTLAGVVEVGQPAGLITFTLTETEDPDRPLAVTLEIGYSHSTVTTDLDQGTLTSLASIAGYMATTYSGGILDVKTLRLDNGEITFMLNDPDDSTVDMAVTVDATTVLVYLDREDAGTLASTAGYMATRVAYS